MHALGFWHEQQRGDRDDFVDIHREHSYFDDSGFRVNFNNDFFTWTPTGHAYDFDSIMHYSAWATSTGEPVITYKGTMDPVVTSSSSRFSPTDIAEINIRYPCNMDAEVEKLRKQIVENHDKNLEVSILSQSTDLYILLFS